MSEKCATRKTMRLTLNGFRDGHLVLATVHSSTCSEALQRVVSAFPAEIQASLAGSTCRLPRGGDFAAASLGPS